MLTRKHLAGAAWLLWVSYRRRTLQRSKKPDPYSADL